MTKFLDFLHPVWKRDIEGYAYSNDLNKTVLKAIDDSLESAEEDVVKSKADSYLDKAEGITLDMWGQWFGVYRIDNEVDSLYRDRIKYAVTVKKGTIPAIIEALHRYFNDYRDNIHIYEPYTNIFYTNKSKLNSYDHMAGKVYNYAVIDVQFSRPFPPDIINLINAYKPAGVRVLTRYVQARYNQDAPIFDLSVPTENLSGYKQVIKQNGIDRYLDGHLNLNSSNTSGDTTLFTTNRSYINGTDVLSGAYGVGSPSFNYACTSVLKINPTMDSIMTDLISQGTPAPNDVYYLTGNDTQSEAMVTIPQANRNLIRNSNFYNGLSLWGTGNGGIDRSVVDDPEIGQCLKVASSVTDRFYYMGDNPFVQGDTYSISVYVKADANTTISIGQNDGYKESFSVGTEWQRISYSHIATGIYTLSVFMIPDSTVYFSNFKVENGDQVTDWSPAPEDGLMHTDYESMNFYAFLDLKTYIQTYFPEYVTEHFPDGEITRQDLVNIIQDYGAFFIKFRILTSEQLSYSFKLYNFNEQSWQNLSSGDISSQVKSISPKVTYNNSFTNNNGILGICLNIPELPTKDYNLAISFLDWSFRKYLGKYSPPSVNTVSLV